MGMMVDYDQVKEDYARLNDRIAELEKEVVRLTAMIDNGLGWEDLDGNEGERHPEH